MGTLDNQLEVFYFLLCLAIINMLQSYLQILLSEAKMSFKTRI